MASSIDIFFSQRSLTSPCTGSSIFFDFGKLCIDSSRVANKLNGQVTLWSTLRHEGYLWEHNENGTFNIEMTSSELDPITEWKTIMEFGGEKISLLYFLRLTLTETEVTGADLYDIQVSKC